jgi:glycosyltransferase involved in cell wall biosynthesis
MKLSVIIATRNRANAIPPCLNSVAVAFAKAGPLDAEIVIVDNGSTDDTAATIEKWANVNSVTLQALSEPRPGKARALNRALRAARGQLLVFTDDDCRLHCEYVNDFLRHDAATPELVLRGGRIELGDPTDLPITINTTDSCMRWSRAMNSAKHGSMSGLINGCNMAMRRKLVEYLGFFDEDFGPGANLWSGADTDYIYRAYSANAIIEYVPDMVVFHHHGRKTVDAGHKLFRNYMIGGGAICMKYLFREPNLCRTFYWDFKRAIKETIRGTNTFLPNIRFSHKHKVKFAAVGALEYFLMCMRTGRPDKLFGTLANVQGCRAELESLERRKSDGTWLPYSNDF